MIRGLAAVAQLDRVLGYEPRGRGFDSCQPHHLICTGRLLNTVAVATPLGGTQRARFPVHGEATPPALGLNRSQPFVPLAPASLCENPQILVRNEIGTFVPRARCKPQ